MIAKQVLTVFVAWCVLLCVPPTLRAQDAPLTKLEPIRYETGFLRDAVRKFWRIEPSQPYHRSGVKVSCPQTSFAGSGIVVRTVDDKAFVVLTNQHVVEGCEGQFVNIIACNGVKTNAKVVWTSEADDVAVLINTNGGVENGVEVYDGEAQPGEEVTVLAFGGPGRMVVEEDIRPFVGKVIRSQYSAPLCVDAYTVSGDSGAGMIHTETKSLCGINWGHFNKPEVTVSGNWVAGRPCASNVTGKDIVRILTQVCAPYGCRPRICQPRGRVIIEQQPIQQPVQPPATQLPVDPQQTEPVQGPPGKDGEPGPPGPPGPAPTQAQIEAAIEAYLAANPQTISLALIDENGIELDRDTVPIGGTLKLQFREIAKEAEYASR